MGAPISIHALLAESDIRQSTARRINGNFYPRSPCGERRYLINTYHRIFGISIHALLAESDGGSGVGSWPCAIFLSTLSLRRATARRASRQQPAGISIHALLAESDQRESADDMYQYISIHALLAESDVHFDNYNLHCVISIHALLAESDRYLINTYHRIFGISIHALLAESDGGSGVGSWPCAIFLSTLSLRRATLTSVVSSAGTTGISIHALLAESDSIKPFFGKINTNFYPRSPCGERPAAKNRRTRSNRISIHALLAESDRRPTYQPNAKREFLSTLSLRRATHPKT